MKPLNLDIKPPKPSAKQTLMRVLPPIIDAMGARSMQRLIMSQAESRLTEQQARRVLDILKVMLEEW